MTVTQAIERADALTPNGCSRPEKLRWLASLDGRVKRELHDTHHGAPAELPEESEGETLLIPAPWDEAYLYHLSAMIAYAQGETARYNESIAMFRALYADYADHYRRTHLPRGGTFRY